MYIQIFKLISNYIKRNISQDFLFKLQKILVNTSIYIRAEDLIAIILLLSLFLFIISLILLSVIKWPIIISVLFLFLPSVIMIIYISYNREHRKENIEEQLPDYLNQIASLLNVGLGFESALEELSKTSKGPLNNEIKQLLIETQFKKPFNESLMDIANRNDLDNLRYIFQIIIHTRESGGNLAEVLEDISHDLKEIILLKKQRRASVMMSVMLIIISSTIATPFALGMIGLYSEFIEKIGKNNPLINTIPLASFGYITIQSILVSFLLGVVLYSNYKKGVKYLIILLPASLIVYFVSRMIFTTIIGL